jgi:hypothetical protein
MRLSLWTILALMALAVGTPRVAAADTISVGLFALIDIGNGATAFDITNLTCLGITVTGLTADISGDGSLTILASDFTTATDGSGNVNCTVPGFAADGGCNVAVYDLLSATLTGTLSPTGGFPGLPDGFGIESAFTATILPLSGPTLAVGDIASIDATLVPVTTTPVPEPSTGPLLAIGLVGLLAGYGAERRTRLTKRLGFLRN